MSRLCDVRIGCLVLCLGIAGCAGEVDSATAAPAPTARAEPAGCIEEFVQEFEDRAEDPPRAIPTGLCWRDDPEGPPKFPAMSRKIRLEYQRGDYYVVQDTASWTFDEPDVQRGCMVAKMVRTRVVERVEGETRESVHVEGNEIKRSAVTGEQYGSSIALGSPLTEEVDAPGLRISRESTPHALDCIRAVQQGLHHASICAFAQPRRCASTRVLLPAEIRTPNTTNGVQVGRTTRLTVGGTSDRSGWSLP